MAKEGKHILLIEDEPGLVITLTDRLKSEGYAGVHAGDGLKGEQMARERTPDLIILDLMLPKKGGLDVCRDLRNEGVTTPILMLTARGQTNEKVVGLKLGADDYLTKPYDMLELLARIESLLRRPAAYTGSFSAMPRYSFGTITVDFRSMEVFRKGKIINISQREFQLLKHFIEHRNTPLCQETILNAVWGYDSMPTTRTIDTHITWRRQKLEDNPHHPRFFLTVHGVGYKFVG